MSVVVRTPERLLAEYRADAVTHALGVAFALIAGPAIVALAPEGPARASAAVYAATLLATFGFSAAYNLLTESPWRDWLRQLDHGAIYLKIAGSYTPFAVVSFPPAVGAKLLLGVWTVAAIGFGVKIAAPRRFNFIAIPLYLAMGWAMVFVLDEAIAALRPEALMLIVAGGVVYTGGVAFHLWESLPFQTAIWHVHVLIGTVCIYAAIAVELLSRAAV
jgi:hemolysin III